MQILTFKMIDRLKEQVKEMDKLRADLKEAQSRPAGLYMLTIDRIGPPGPATGGPPPPPMPSGGWYWRGSHVAFGRFFTWLQVSTDHHRHPCLLEVRWRIFVVLRFI